MIATQLVEILDPVPAGGGRWFTTLEGENPGGSIKDRLVVGELQALVRAGTLRPGDEVCELSAGSTARSLAYHARALGLRCTVFVPAGAPEPLVSALRAADATVREVAMESALQTYSAFCAENRVRPLNQLTDRTLERHYRPLGAEVEAALGRVDVVVGGVGTGHSLLGTAHGMAHPPRVVTAEPAQKGLIPGVRNLTEERFGPEDTCGPAEFDDRVVLEASALFPSDRIQTSAGPVLCGRSFQLVLAAASAMAHRMPKANLFLVGAANKRT